MKREILFRGKRVDNGEWVYGFYNRCEARLTYTEEHYKNNPRSWIQTLENDGFAGQLVHVDTNTVGQYTGLTDKNGNKIFEGDIVLKRTYNGKKPFPVTFDSGMFHCGYGGGSSTATHGYTLDDRQIEIIGNIFDNPELMENGR